MYEKIAFTVYPVTDVKRARHFYEEILGFEPGLSSGDDERAWVEYDLPGGGCLAISNMIQGTPGSTGATVAFEVSDREALLAELKAKGVTIAMEHIPSPVCDMSIISDSEGNSLILHQLHADRKAGKEQP